jgi:hypothetical protein
MKRDPWDTGLDVLARAIGTVVALAIWRVVVAAVEWWAK